MNLQLSCRHSFSDPEIDREHTFTVAFPYSRRFQFISSRPVKTVFVDIKLTRFRVTIGNIVFFARYRYPVQRVPTKSVNNPGNESAAEIEESYI